MIRCRVRHPEHHKKRCELPSSHKQRHQLIGGRTWAKGKAAQVLFMKEQKATNQRYRAKCNTRRRRALKELAFQDRIRSEVAIARYLRRAA